MNFNKVCNLSDFDFLLEDIKEIFPHFAERHVFPHVQGDYRYRKLWENTMAIRAFDRYDKLTRKATILGVGAGAGVTSFYLTKHVKQVVATDIYDQEVWNAWSPKDMPENPGKYAPYPYEEKRLVVKAMDGRYLKFRDETFDAIYSSSSIEHFGEPEDIQQAVREMYRVLKPGGIIALSTEFKINDKAGWIPNTYMFTPESLYELIIDPSECFVVDEPDYHVDQDTRDTLITLTLTDDLIRQEQDVPTPHIALDYNEYHLIPVSVVLQKEE